jgi:hypothetical protein
MAERITPQPPAEDDGLYIDPDVVFSARLGIARARSSELLAILRWLRDQPLRATNDNEDGLRNLESALSSALHFAGRLKREASK